MHSESSFNLSNSLIYTDNTSKAVKKKTNFVLTDRYLPFAKENINQYSEKKSNSNQIISPNKMRLERYKKMIKLELIHDLSPSKQFILKIN